MTIKITECEGTDAGRSLLRDLAKYECLRDWVQALVDRTAEYIPLDCHVIVDEEHAFWLYQAGQLFRDQADACLRRLERRSESSQRLPRDHGFVHADMFEAELFISLINVEE